MTQKSINLGTADQGNGDPIRVAFGKVNDNFTELYTALGLNAGGLNIGAFEFAGSVMSTIDSSSITIDQATTISSNLTVGGDVIPSVANGGDLGSAAKPWRSLYVSNNTLYIGGTAVAVNSNGQLTVNGSTMVGPAGATGPIGINFRGAYDGGTVYVNGDVVTLQGSTYRMVSQNLGVGYDPIGYAGMWAVLAQKGDTGSVAATGDLRFTDSLMHPEGDATRGVVLTPDVSKMILPLMEQWEFSSLYHFAQTSSMYIIPPDPNQVYDAQTVTVDLTDISQFLQDVVNGLGSYVSASLAISVNGGANQPITNRFSSNGTVLIYFAVPQGFTGPALVTSIGITAVFENRIQLNTGAGHGIYLDDNFDIDSKRDITLVAGDDLRITGANHVALRNTSHNDPIRIVTDYDRYEMQWSFDTAGTLNTPQALPRTFTAVLDTDHQAGAGSTPVYRLDAWQLTVTFQIDPATGSVETIISPAPFVQVTNPGYVSGNTFAFGSSDHGIPDYVFTVALQNVAGGSGNYTADVSASPPPDVPATIYAPDQIRLRADGADLVFDGNGSLTIPGDIKSNGNINIEINLSDSTLRRWQFGEDGELTLPEDAVVKTISGNLTIEGESYVIIDSATNGQIDIGRSSGVGAVALGNKSNGTDVVVDDLFVANGVYEFFSSLADATGVVTHNCANGHLFYHTSPDANWTVNITNLINTYNRATSVTLIIAQGATGYIPNAVQIAGVAQTLNWQGNATPTPSSNRTDVVTFSIINNSGTYIVLGQLTGF